MRPDCRRHELDDYHGCHSVPVFVLEPIFVELPPDPACLFAWLDYERQAIAGAAVEACQGMLDVVYQVIVVDLPGGQLGRLRRGFQDFREFLVGPQQDQRLAFRGRADLHFADVLLPGCTRKGFGLR